jgi:glutathione synthase/RimK-type ligase-like ATP-grasp enzyme
MKTIATIARNTADSPNMTANDAAILECITAELQQRGAVVTRIGEDEEIPRGTQAVCTMSRTAGTIERLKQAEAQGITVINTPAAVENCSRRHFMEILRENNIPQPQFIAVNSANELDNAIFPCWIKKADGWSNHSDDVTFAATMQEASAAIQEMNLRGITGYIQMQHCTGDIIKFYGVGNDFFHYCYPGNGKFGKEAINGAPQHYSFDSNTLKSIAQDAAKAIGLDIYGGDAIITPQGGIYIIDMNDFPSFTAIRDIAAVEIATLIMNKTR